MSDKLNGLVMSVSADGGDKMGARLMDDASARKRARIFVVLSMHRSGSSVLARALGLLGVDLGPNLMEAASGNNEKGFFEDQDIVNLNERILKKLDRSWSDLRPITAAALLSPELKEERQEACAILQSRLRGSRMFGFKDPRTAILLPFWKEVFSTIGCDTVYVLGVRNPLSVAYSLRARDGIQIEKGVALWGRYSIDALTGTADSDRVFLSFDELMGNPAAELGRVAGQLQLNLPGTDSSEYIEFAQDFLDDKLRHHKVGHHELKASDAAGPSIVQLYELMLEACGNGTTSEELQAKSGELAGRLLETASAHNLIEKLELYLRSLVSQNAAKDVRLTELERLRAEVHAAHDRAVEERDAALHALEVQRGALENLEHRRAEVHAAHDRAVEERDAALHALEVQRGTLENLEHLRAEMQAAYDRVVFERDRALQIADARAKRIIETEGHLHEAQRVLLDTQTELLDISKVLARVSEERSLFLTVLKGSLEAIEAYKQSSSWRLTAPLRAVAKFARAPLDARRSLTVSSVAPISSFVWKRVTSKHIGVRTPEIDFVEEPEIVFDRRGPRQLNQPVVATILHAYCPEVLPDIFARISAYGRSVVLYITAPFDRIEQVVEQFEATNLSGCVIRVADRGRDISAFLAAHEFALADGAPLILKLHTMRSTQLSSDEQWRTELFDALISKKAFDDALNAFSCDDTLGLLAPCGHVLRVGDINKQSVEKLAGLSERIGMPLKENMEEGFVAGSMFFVRPVVYLPLLDLKLGPLSFEPEQEQISGTLAHAIERLSGTLTRKAGLRLAELGKVGIAPDVLPVKAFRFGQAG